MDSQHGRIERMKRRTFLKAGLTSLALPSTSSSAVDVQRKRTDDAQRLSIPSVTLAGVQLGAEADDLPEMYNPQLVATIQAADSMVVKRETNDPKGDVVLSFSRYDDRQGVGRRVGRVVLPFRNLRTGLYVRGSVHYRQRIDAAGVDVGVRSTMVFDQRVRVIVYVDEIHGVHDAIGRPMWIGNTVVVARPAG
jgi:hypothetical protein